MLINVGRRQGDDQSGNMKILRGERLARGGARV
ncbi:hypothetical protein DT23_11485 [Thioclava indica]|uniref:Uncharacterized protein n=1 Tax=Thioclava indica TaxID=1353528 RepID=A0A074JZP3_9RHOB|nr:hypothetical protein DT23_11485 [Thioclava indica]